MSNGSSFVNCPYAERAPLFMSVFDSMVRNGMSAHAWTTEMETVPARQNLATLGERLRCRKAGDEAAALLLANDAVYPHDPDVRAYVINRLYTLIHDDELSQQLLTSIKARLELSVEPPVYKILLAHLAGWKVYMERVQRQEQSAAEGDPVILCDHLDALRSMRRRIHVYLHLLLEFDVGFPWHRAELEAIIRELRGLEPESDIWDDENEKTDGDRFLKLIAKLDARLAASF